MSSCHAQPKAASDWAGKPLFCKTFGAVAQLGEHLVCNQGVAGSIPVRSTCPIVALQWVPPRGLFLSACRSFSGQGPRT